MKFPKVHQGRGPKLGSAPTGKIRRQAGVKVAKPEVKSRLPMSPAAKREIEVGVERIKSQPAGQMHRTKPRVVHDEPSKVKSSGVRLLRSASTDAQSTTPSPGMKGYHQHLPHKIEDDKYYDVKLHTSIKLGAHTMQPWHKVTLLGSYLKTVRDSVSVATDAS